MPVRMDAVAVTSIKQMEYTSTTANLLKKYAILLTGTIQSCLSISYWFSLYISMVHNLRLYDTALDMAAINKALVVQDVAVISSQICNDTLEDYFKQITGGEGIA